MDENELKTFINDVLSKTSLAIGNYIHFPTCLSKYNECIILKIIGLGLGVKEKLFDTVLALDSPSTSTEIACKCSLKERFMV